MPNTENELSGRETAFVSWIEFLGMIVFLSSRLFFRQHDWMAIAGFALIASGYFYRMYFDWKAGRKKSVRRRLIFFIVAVIAAGIVAYISHQKNN